MCPPVGAKPPSTIVRISSLLYGMYRICKRTNNVPIMPHRDASTDRQLLRVVADRAFINALNTKEK